MVQDPPLPISEGTLVAGKYQLGPVLGRGGMGVVYAAFHTRLQIPLAVKFLHTPSRGGADDEVARFEREASICSQIKSEHVVRVMDIDQLPTGQRYIVMEGLEGCDLAQMLVTKGTLSIIQAVDYVLQACEAISEAHVLGIVHRNIEGGAAGFVCAPVDCNAKHAWDSLAHVSRANAIICISLGVLSFGGMLGTGIMTKRAARGDGTQEWGVEDALE